MFLAIGFYHWQTLVAGLIALFAALITVWVTLRVERGKTEREVDALRKSLAVELRGKSTPRSSFITASTDWAPRRRALISGKMVESKSRMTALIIYPANAGKIGLLGAEAMDVMIVYDLLETARNGAARLMNSQHTRSTRRHQLAANVMETADAFLAACSHARGLLPKLRTGNPSDDAKDEALTQKINDAQRGP